MTTNNPHGVFFTKLYLGSFGHGNYNEGSGYDLNKGVTHEYFASFFKQI
jgi:hypothetical protein